MTGASGQGTWVKENVASVLESEFSSSLLGNPANRETIRATQEERKLERSQKSQKDFVWRNDGAVEKRARAGWESVRKGTG